MSEFLDSTQQDTQDLLASDFIVVGYGFRRSIGKSALLRMQDSMLKAREVVADYRANKQVQPPTAEQE